MNKAKKIDRYKTAKCPICGRFMALDKATREWRCRNPKCQKEVAKL